MKFTLKTLVAAVALVAATSANAAIDKASSGNGSLFLSLWDDASQSSYTLDLNLTINSFISGASTGTDYTYAPDALLTSWLSGKSLSSVVWNISAGDKTGAHRYIETAGTDLTTYFDNGTKLVPAAISNGQTRNLGTMDNYLDAVNAVIGNGNSAVLSVADNGVYAGDDAVWGSHNVSKSTWVTTSTLANSSNILSLWLLEAPASGSAGLQSKWTEIIDPTNSDAPYAAILNQDGTLTITLSPVPEADTWALMVAGLGLLGFAARRRNTLA